VVGKAAHKRDSPLNLFEICSPKTISFIADPFKSDPVYGNALCWRPGGKTGYRYRYTGEELSILDAKLQAQAHLSGPSYVIFNNIHSKQDALCFPQRS